MNGDKTISFPLPGGLFNFRVAGIAVYNDKILLHKTPSDHFWSLPGGRVDVFELTKETLQREMVEETGMKVDVVDLMWIVENFFSYEDKKYHEIGFYYRMHMEVTGSQQDFQTIEAGSDLRFHWHELDKLHEIKIYPEFITADRIRNTVQTAHIVADFKNLNEVSV